MADGLVPLLAAPARMRPMEDSVQTSLWGYIWIWRKFKVLIKRHNLTPIKRRLRSTAPAIFHIRNKRKEERECQQMDHSDQKSENFTLAAHDVGFTISQIFLECVVHRGTSHDWWGSMSREFLRIRDRQSQFRSSYNTCLGHQIFFNRQLKMNPDEMLQKMLNNGFREDEEKVKACLSEHAEVSATCDRQGRCME